MEWDIACTECGAAILNEDASTPESQRSPCPACGSQARTVHITATDTVFARDEAEVVTTITADGAVTGHPRRSRSVPVGMAVEHDEAQPMDVVSAKTGKDSPAMGQGGQTQLDSHARWSPSLSRHGGAGVAVSWATPTARS